MLKLILKPEAVKDLEKIYQYTFETWGIDQAERYQDELFRGMQLLLKHGDLGKPYTYSNKGYRKLQINRHLIFYRVDDSNCSVIRILHDRMDVKKRLK